MSELNKESADQAGGDERAAFEAYRDRRNALLESEGHKPGSKWHVTNAHYPTWEASRAALAQPSPAQAEAERPEVVARVVHSNPVVLGQCGPLNANDELMTVAQHAASVARWAEMFNRVEQQRDSALARVAELAQALRHLLHNIKASGKRIDLGLAKECAEDALARIDSTVSAQAQHSVPDGAADLCRFLAKLYCELDGLRYSTAKLPAEQIADALIFKWPVLQGTRNQLNIKRISEQPYDESKLHSAIAAMLAAAPGKEGV
ncbi:hypothetical protein ABLG07_005187 [Pseudomonas aeruginosa]